MKESVLVKEGQAMKESVLVKEADGSYLFWTYQPTIGMLLTCGPTPEEQVPTRLRVNVPQSRGLLGKFESYPTEESAMVAGYRAAQSMQLPELQDSSTSAPSGSERTSKASTILVGVQKLPNWIRVGSVIELAFEGRTYVRIVVHFKDSLFSMNEPKSHDVVLEFEGMGTDDRTAWFAHRARALRPLPAWAADAVNQALFEERASLRASLDARMRAIKEGALSDPERPSIVVGNEPKAC